MVVDPHRILNFSGGAIRLHVGPLDQVLEAEGAGLPLRAMDRYLRAQGTPYPGTALYLGAHGIASGSARTMILVLAFLVDYCRVMKLPLFIHAKLEEDVLTSVHRELSAGTLTGADGDPADLGDLFSSWAKWMPQPPPAFARRGSLLVFVPQPNRGDIPETFPVFAERPAAKRPRLECCACGEDKEEKVATTDGVFAYCEACTGLA